MMSSADALLNVKVSDLTEFSLSLSLSLSPSLLVLYVISTCFHDGYHLSIASVYLLLSICSFMQLWWIILHSTNPGGK